MRRPHGAVLSFVAMLAVLAFATDAAFAGGFEIQEYSARGLANSNAGKGAVAEDAVTVFHNPAGLTRILGFNGVAAFHIIDAGNDWNDSGSSASLLPPLLGGPASGGDGGDGDAAFVPGLFMAYQIDEQWAVGLGVNAPFGLATSYDDDWKGRYLAIDTELHTLNINPAVAYKPFECLSIGVGVSYQTADALLSRAVDFGTILNGAAQTTPESLDGEAEIEGDGDSWGWNFGIMWEMSESTRFGLAYRSHVHHKLEGDGDFTVPATAAAIIAAGGTGAFADVDASARVTLPESISLSAYHDVNEQWAILADITWTHWSRFKELRIKFDNPAQPDAVTPERWESTWRYSLGAIYKHDEDWTFRAGLAWDESPIQSHYRTARIPLNSRFWVSLGVGYKFCENAAIDLAYLHVFMQDGKISEAASTTQVLRGTMEVAPNILSLQITVNF